MRNTTTDTFDALAVGEAEKRRSRKQFFCPSHLIILFVLFIYAVVLMLPFYVVLATSITPYQEINAQTGEAWKIEDVPMLWRAEVQALLDESDENTEG